jgi:hypothetical protein
MCLFIQVVNKIFNLHIYIMDLKKKENIIIIFKDINKLIIIFIYKV